MDETASLVSLPDTGAPARREHPMWHVTVTYAGEAVDPAELAAALRRLADERPFMGSARYAVDRVEVRYWDEAAELQDAAALALRLWMDHRPSVGLPDWRAVALEVLDRDTLLSRGPRDGPPSAIGLDDVRPMHAPAAPPGAPRPTLER